MVKLNKAQTLVCANYGGGDYAHLADEARLYNGWEAFRDSLDDCGDTLFVFLMVELADSEDCTDMTEAARRVRVAETQLAEMASILERSV